LATVAIPENSPTNQIAIHETSKS